MNGKLTNNWKKLFVWVSAYLSYVAFALVGGYVFVKEEDEEVRKQTKLALFVTIIFACLSAFLTIFYSCMGLGSTSYNSNAYDFYRWFSFFVTIGKIVTFAVFACISFFTKSEEPKKVEAKKVEE